MIVIAHKTEQRLLSDLRRCMQDTPAQKCFYIEFSRVDIDQRHLYEAFLRAWDQLPNAYTAQVYLCHNKDIFVIMQGLMRRQFLTLMNDVAKQLEISAVEDLVDVFEVGMHWPTLEDLCQEKLAAFNAQQINDEKEHRHMIAHQAAERVLEHIDASLIKDVSQRRMARRDIVVLIVDDDQLTRTLVSNVLSQECRVVHAADGAEGLSQYLVHAPDVMFLDIGLPDINGHDVLECLFQLDTDAYVIMFSGRKDKSNIMRALETGAQGFVGKPFTKDKLFEYTHKSPFIVQKMRQSLHTSRHMT